MQNEATIEPSNGPVLPLKQAIMLAWRPECYRSSATARTFQIPLYLIWPQQGTGKSGASLAVRYVRSITQTLKIISINRPRAVIVYNLPPFLLLTVLFARLFNRHHIIMDFHSGALSDPKWRMFRPLYRAVARRAPFTVSHNRFDGRVIREWGGRPVHLIALPHDFDLSLEPAPSSPRILVVCSFNADEPIDMLMEAFQTVPEVRFEVTGNYRKRGLLPEQVPANVTLTGFLNYAEYLRRLAASTAVATFSDRSHIMQMAVHEAISLGVPVVTNRSETLMEVLEQAGEFCDLDVESLASAFRKVAARCDELRTIARMLKARRRADLKAELASLRKEVPSTLFKERAGELDNPIRSFHQVS